VQDILATAVQQGKMSSKPTITHSNLVPWASIRISTSMLRFRSSVLSCFTLTVWIDMLLAFSNTTIRHS